MANRRGAWSAAASFLLTAAAHGVPRAAQLVEPDAACRAELAAAVKELTGTEVTLAPDSLVGTDRLVLETIGRRDAQGRPLDGRRRQAPIVLQLRQEDGRCVLLAGQERATLRKCRCVPLPG